MALLNSTNALSLGTKAAVPTPRRRHLNRQRCIVEGCQKFARGLEGVCIRHGGQGNKLCQVPGCIHQVRKGGVCVKHGAEKRLCSKPNCNRTLYSKGLCFGHHRSHFGKSSPTNSQSTAVQSAQVQAPLAFRSPADELFFQLFDVENHGPAIDHEAVLSAYEGALLKSTPEVCFSVEESVFMDLTNIFTAPPSDAVFVF